jgi:predicted alpha/beta-fold hydrolase
MAPSPEFRPPAWPKGGMGQTIWAHYAPRSAALSSLQATSRPEILATDDADHIRVHWNTGRAPDAPVLVLLHGLTGCAQSSQVLGLADKGLAAGFAIVRADLRNARGPTPSIGIGHAGRSEDVNTILDHVAARAPGRAIALIGFSLGGNVALKALGEMADQPRPELAAAVTISVPIDLSAACTAIDAAGNWIFRRYFVTRLKRIVERRRREGRGEYGGIDLRGVESIREFDGRLVAPLCGFDSAEDYYRRSSALAIIGEIRVPTLLIQAIDDPFIPFAAYEHASIAANSAVSLLTPQRGGHAGFWGRSGIDSDRFWAEHRAIEFCRQRAR